MFRILNIHDTPFGVGGWNNPLNDFVSVATSDFAPGTRLYVKELDGLYLRRDIKGGYFQYHTYHNGCVRVDDYGGGGSCSITLFVRFFTGFRDVRDSLPGQVHAVPLERRLSVEGIQHWP